MKATSIWRSWRVYTSASAVGVLICSLSLQGAPPSADNSTRSSSVVRAGPGIPATNEYPIAPPVIAYPADTVLSVGEEGLWPPISPGEPGVLSSVAGAECELDVDCDDCLPCTQDRCSEGFCSAGSENDGDPCFRDEHCGTEPAGTCVLTGGPKFCGHFPEDEGELGDCNDGIFCNGTDFCQGGGCVSVGDPCVGQGLRSISEHTPFAILLRPGCSRKDKTSAAFRNCWATKTCGRRRFTHTC